MQVGLFTQISPNLIPYGHGAVIKATILLYNNAQEILRRLELEIASRNCLTAGHESRGTYLWYTVWHIDTVYTLTMLMKITSILEVTYCVFMNGEIIPIFLY